MYHLHDHLFRTVFDQLSEPRILVQADVPFFTVILCNKAYKTAVRRQDEDLSRKSFWQLANDQNTISNISKAALQSALEETLAGNVPVSLPPVNGFPGRNDQESDSPSWCQIELQPVSGRQPEDTGYLMFTFHDVTRQVISSRELKRAQQSEEHLLREQQVLNEELTAINEELSATNEELIQSQESLEELNRELEELNHELEERVKQRTEALYESSKQLQHRQEELEALNEELMASNEELADTQESLKETVDQLAESEELFRTLFEQAPVGMCLLKGKDQVITLANDHILTIWGRSRDEIIHKPHKEARPELEDQPVHDWLDEVYQTGIPRVNNELKVYLHHKGGLREAYVNSLYQPLRDSKGTITGLLVILDEVTDRVTTRREMDRTQELFRMAVESAELGTWYIDTRNRKFTPSARLKEFFGYYPNEEVTWEACAERIADQYRDKVISAIRTALAKGENYDLEYPVTGFHDGKLRWLRATGKLYRNEEGNPHHLSGTVLDITSRKLEEIRKNDFIAIVSHELKTPLTSLKAYLQLLHTRAEKGIYDSFMPTALEKSLVQTDKMHMLIKGFLDIARLESGTMYLDIKRFDVNELLEEAVQEISILSSSHKISFIRQTPLMVKADREKIAQVAINLLNNAIKYSPKGSSIEINSLRHNGMVQVSIKDEGIGINAQDIDRVFDRFYRVEDPRTRTIAGFGIGLYLCAEIINRHNGEIRAESQPGKGSVFTFTLPAEN